jgi:hypothetical protein
MPIGFKRDITITLHVPTPSGSLIEVTPSGVNTAGQAAINLMEGDGTGYTNYFTQYDLPAKFSPGVAKRYDLQMQGYRFLGECSIKVAPQYANLIASGSHITIGDTDWQYQRLSELGVGAGNDRIVLALTRKR